MTVNDSGRKIANRVYRDLERLYPIKIKKGRMEELDDYLSTQEYGALKRAVEAIETTVAKLPKPEHPDARKNAKPRHKKLDV